MMWLYPIYTDVKHNTMCPSTTQGQKIENRPLGVQGKRDKKLVKGKKAGKSTKSPETASKLPYINPRQQAYLYALLDPQSPTYGNQTASYKAAYGTASDTVAAVKASQAVRRDKVHTWIEEILRRHGVDTQARVVELAAIAHNKSAPRTIRKIVEQGDKRKVITTTEEPTASERLKAIDQLNKLSGDYAKAQAAGTLQAQDEYTDLMSRTFTRDKQRTSRSDRAKNVTPEDPEGSTGGRG
jgi:hypothetical protein